MLGVSASRDPRVFGQDSVAIRTARANEPCDAGMHDPLPALLAHIPSGAAAERFYALISRSVDHFAGQLHEIGHVLTKEFVADKPLLRSETRSLAVSETRGLFGRRKRNY